VPRNLLFGLQPLKIFCDFFILEGYSNDYLQTFNIGRLKNTSPDQPAYMRELVEKPIQLEFIITMRELVGIEFKAIFL